MSNENKNDTLSDLEPGQDVPSNQENGPSVANDAASSLVGKTTRSIKVATKNAAKEKDKTGIVVVILIIVGIGAIAAFGMLNKSRSDAATKATTVTPRFDVGMTGEEQVRSFTRKTAQEVNDLTTAVNELKKITETLVKRQDSVDRSVGEALKKVVTDFEQKSNEKFKMMEETAKATSPSESEDTKRLMPVLDAFRTNLANLKTTPAEARAKAIKSLREAGVSEAKIKNLLADSAVKAGCIAVGDVAEPPISENERLSLPEFVRPHIDTIRNRIYGAAETEGQLFPEQNEGEIKTYLSAQCPKNTKDITDAIVKKTAYICRIRRENITPEQEDVLAYFVTMRDEKQIKREDYKAIASMVFAAKDKIPMEPRPGQLLTIVHTVMRSIGPNTKINTEGFKPIDDAGIGYAIEVVASAVSGAVSLGRDQTAQFEIAARSLGNYLDTARYTATEEQKKAILNRAVAKAGERIVPKVDKSSETSGGVQDKNKDLKIGDDNDGEYLFFGPLKIERGKGLRAIVYAVPGLLRASGFDPSTERGSIAAITAWEQAVRLSPDTIRRFAGKPGGGRSFMAELVPEIMTQAGTASELAGTPISVAGDRKELEKSVQGNMMRGVAIGAIYGPVNHEKMLKATSAAGEAIAVLEKQAPLTNELAAKMQGAKPFEAIIIAFDAIRPGRFSYPASRYQDITQRMEGQSETIASLRHLIQKEAGDHAAGEFEETARLLLPMAVAHREDVRTDVSVVMGLVRKDLIRFGSQFLAEVMASRNVTAQMLPRYAAAVGSDGSGNLVAQAAAQTGKIIQDRFSTRGDMNPEDVVPTAYAVVGEAMPEIEKKVVQEVVLSRVVPRLRQIGLGGEQLQEAIRAARTNINDVVIQPYTPARIDNWALQISDQVRRNGAPQDAGRNVSSSGNNQSRNGSELWVTPTIIKPTGSQGQLIGTTTTLVATRRLVIPAGSYANGHILSAVDAEVGGRGNLPIMVQVNFAWEGPAGSRVAMRDSRLLGSANAMAGPERIAIDLKRLSYVLPSGREISADINGYVSDNINGQYGALGHWKWNAEKVLPLAVTAGGFQGTAEALKANSTTQIVGMTGVTTTTKSANAFEQALYGGTAGGFGIMSDYVKSVLQDVKPSVAMENGQRVSIVLIDPVALDVSEAEYKEIITPSSGFAP